MRYKYKKGFALPTVLVTSIIMLTVLIVSFSSIVSVRVALREQYYQRLAGIASEAGVSYAKACIDAYSSDFTQPPLSTWTDTNPLMPNTDCGGSPQVDCSSTATLVSDSRCYIMYNSDVGGNKVLTSFKVPRPKLDTGGKAIDITSSSTADLLRPSNNTSWRVYNQMARVSSIYISTQVTKDFSFTNGAQTWTVPTGVTSLTIEVWGAKGGDAQMGGGGAYGGYAKGTLSVTPGKTLGVYVGGGGSTGINGFNGGGGSSDAGTYDGNSGGGGGASDVRYDGALADGVAATTSASRKIVAGGGGGGGGGHNGYDISFNGSDGGSGGGASGGNGGSLTINGTTFGNAAAGTQSSGYSSTGLGGNGTSSGGGGGGGYWGGNGGASNNGGAGGSGYTGGVTAPTNTAGVASISGNSNGFVRIKYITVSKVLVSY